MAAPLLLLKVSFKELWSWSFRRPIGTDNTRAEEILPFWCLLGYWGGFQSWTPKAIGARLHSACDRVEEVMSKSKIYLLKQFGWKIYSSNCVQQQPFRYGSWWVAQTPLGVWSMLFEMAPGNTRMLQKWWYGFSRWQSSFWDKIAPVWYMRMYPSG